MVLKSGLTIFGIDGEARTSFGIAENARGKTGYGGPNPYFTKIGGDLMSGTVNFITPIVEAVRLHRGIGVHHHHPGIAFTFDRIPPQFRHEPVEGALGYPEMPSNL